MIFSKILEVRGTKMKKIQKNYKLNADEPAAGVRVKTSVERRRPTAFRDGGLSVFLFKTGKYWNGKGRKYPL
jgi:hypothetical protein